MTPVQIDEVVCSWRSACEQRDVLRRAITAHLPRDSMPVEDRADWILRTVDRLLPVLATPHDLATTAVEMAALRHAVTSSELRSDKQALMSGLETVIGPLPEECRLAWHRACGLFGDVIAELIFNPFRDC
jgi:hypothetical protein